MEGEKNRRDKREKGLAICDEENGKRKMRTLGDWRDLRRTVA